MGTTTGAAGTAEQLPLRLTDLWDVRGLAQRLSEPDSDGFRRSWIMLFPEGQFTHPDYGKLRFSKARLSEIKRHFDDRVRHIDIALDANHDQDKATGWLEQLQLRGPQLAESGQPLPAGLWGLVRWTPLGMTFLKDQIYRYFSPEFGPWTDPETGEEFQDVLRGGGLTNRPFLKVMPALALAERLAERLAEPQVSRTPWGRIDKACLPDSAFLDPKNRRLPVYEGAGPKDARGRYTRRGALNLQAVHAALAAVNGARSGTPMTGLPAGVKQRLQRWADQYRQDRADPTATAKTAQQTAREPTTPLAHSKDQQVPTKKKTIKPAEELDETQTLDEGQADDEQDVELDAPDAQDDADVTELDEGDDESSMAYDEADGDGADGADEDDAEDAADDGADEDEEDEPPAKPKKRGKKSGGAKGDKQMAEPRDGELTLAEMREELARARYQLYERDVAETLAQWGKGTFQFREGSTREGKPVLKTGQIALSRSFRQAYRAFMLKDGIRLAESSRDGVNRLIEAALSTALVDLTARGSSYDPAGKQVGRRLNEERDQIAEREAVRLAQEAGKISADLDHAAAVKALGKLEPHVQFDFSSRGYKLAERRERERPAQGD